MTSLFELAKKSTHLWWC